MSDARPRRDGGARSGPRRSGPPKRRELPEGYEVEVLPMPEEVPKPDNSAHRAKMDQLASAIDKQTAERDRIQAQIKGRTTSTPGAASESKLARDRLNEIRTEFQALKEERNALTARQKAASELGKAKIEAAKQMRGDLRFTSLAAIDGRIEDLQEQQETTSMSLPEEKALMKEISALRAQRGMVSKYDELMGAANAARDESRSSRETNDARFKELHAEMDAVRARMDAQWAIVKEFDAKRDAERGDVPALIEARNEAHAKVNELYGQRKALYAAHQEEWAAHKAYLDVANKVRTQQRELDQVGWDKYKADQQAARAGAEVEAAKAAEVEAEKHHPWEKEVTDLQVLINTLRSYIDQEAIEFDPVTPQGSAAAAASTEQSLSSFMKAQAASASTQPATGGAAAPKQDFGNARSVGKKTKGSTKPSSEEMGGFMSMLGAGKGKGKKGSKKAAPGTVVSKPVRLDMSLLSQLAKFGVAVPKNTEDVPAALKTLSEKRVHFLNKPAKKSAKQAAAPAATAAAPAPAAAAAPAASSGVSVGDDVSTPYGKGVVQEVRADGMTVVDITGYAAVAYMMQSELA